MFQAKAVLLVVAYELAFSGARPHHDVSASRNVVCDNSAMRTIRHRRAPEETNCTFRFQRLFDTNIPGMTVDEKAHTSEACRWACMHNTSCVALNWNYTEKKCLLLFTASELTNRQAYSDTILMILDTRCPPLTCTNHNPCKNGGTCHVVTNGIGWLKCDCPSGKSGSYCETIAVAPTTEAKPSTSFYLLMILVMIVPSLLIAVCMNTWMKKKQEKERERKEALQRSQEENSFQWLDSLLQFFTAD
ncbi:hypothetical protein LSAT2_032618 [Lamellibrachia satsuma]|nr:hypothetical protein LSAT2_032618 [Lamellibrachia satsuma]